jgi:hypothetical protein
MRHTCTAWAAALDHKTLLSFDGRPLFAQGLDDKAGRR